MPGAPTVVPPPLPVTPTHSPLPVTPMHSPEEEVEEVEETITPQCITIPVSLSV
jgi:hypothetical protein